MSNEALTTHDTWKELQSHQGDLAAKHLRDLFTQDPARFKKFNINCSGLLLDYSKHNITEDTIRLLLNLAKDCNLEAQRDDMFEGSAINTSEGRPALHVALRGSVDQNLEIDGENVTDFVNATLDNIKIISENIRSEKRFTDIVNIGIGGSDLGPQMVCEALAHSAIGPNIHFVSNIDGAHITQTLATLNPETTLFIIASKTFTTLETMANADVAKDWITGNIANHFIAVTGNTEGARAFGITEDHILPMREWIGGRYSLWSAIGLPFAIANGFGAFTDLLAGAHRMDRHFIEAPLDQNMPAIMALLGIWYRNFWDYRAHGIFPYAQNLNRFPAYIQQLDMESGGKHVDKHGNTVPYDTSPVIFGEPGTGSQHAFFQMLHQGTDIIPSDFIAAVNTDHGLEGHHTQLLANVLAQTQALMNGSAADEPYRVFDGNRPSSTLLLENLDAHHLGMLLALYEHKTYVQGCIWGINSFDQWGVELGKVLAKNIAQDIENKDENNKVDASTQGLLQHIAVNKQKNS